MSLAFAHQAPSDELSRPAKGFEELSRNDDAVIALSSILPSDTPAGMGPAQKNVVLHQVYLTVGIVVYISFSCTDYCDNNFPNETIVTLYLKSL